MFTEEHDAFRESFRRFLEREIVPHYGGWERDGIIPRDVFRAAGQAGFLGLEVPEDYGGAGVTDHWFKVVLREEIARAGVIGFGAGLTLHNDICVPYFMRYADAEQRRRWLPGLCSGELLTAIAMTEPNAGSDLGAIATRGQLDGDTYRVSGAKTFITNGINADLVIVAVRTEDAPRHRGLSLLVVERDTPGFSRGRRLAKIGLHAQDTAELFFDRAEVPAANLLGQPGAGFGQLVDNLPAERMSIALEGVCAARAAIDWTVAYVRERSAFGAPLSKLQSVRFTLAEAHTATEVARAFADRCVDRLNAGTLSPEEAAMAKYWCTETQGKVVDACLQLHGGFGYMEEYPIARAFVDARVTRIYGGANEIMKEIISRGMDL